MKPEYWYRQSAVIPYYYENGSLNVVLVTSRKKKKWIIPKGIVERDMTPADSAAKEALEEAGVRGVVAEKAVGSYQREKWGGTCNIEVFPMEVTEILERWQEQGARERVLASIDTVDDLVDDASLKSIIRKLKAHLEEHK
jgi:8-oxo-dGTP pyrophosphatase MutT (NUDIX family)